MSEANNTTPRKQQPPLRTFRVGSVCCAIWANQAQRDGRDVTDYSIRINRRYQKDGQWITTESFFPEHLPQVALVAQKAYESITLKETERETDELPV